MLGLVQDLLRNKFKYEILDSYRFVESYGDFYNRKSFTTYIFSEKELIQKR